MSKAIVVLTWITGGPIVLCILLYIVGETVEHFTQ